MKSYRTYLFPLAFGLLFLPHIKAQDSIHFKRDNFMEGEVIQLQFGVLKVETPYSEDDFTIDWDEVIRISTGTHLMNYMIDGSFRYGLLHCQGDSVCTITSPLGDIHVCRKKDIIAFRGLKQRFMDRVDATVDLGYSMTRANNQRQVTMGASASYTARVWETSITYSSLFSVQDEVEDVERQELDYLFRYIVFRKWVLDPSINFLSNSEQKLNLRTTLQLGMGRYLVRRSSGHLGLGIGFNRNIERYSGEEPDRDSWETSAGTEIKLYNMDNLSLTSKSTLFASLTQKGRWRANFSLVMKYDLPLDFYIKLDGSANYDSQPAADASTWDYVLKTGFGWEF